MATDWDALKGVTVEYVVEFHEALVTESGCWEIQEHATSHGGYGQTKFRGQWVRANRMMYFASTGIAPIGKVVRHTCDNPPCINPEHLLLGTQKDNAKDRVDRGRQRGGGGPTGENHWSRRMPDRVANGTRNGMSKNNPNRPLRTCQCGMTTIPSNMAAHLRVSGHQIQE